MDEESFSSAVKENLPKIKSFLATKFSLQQADLDDLAQNVVIKAWRQLGNFRGNCSFSTWLHTIARHEALNFLKKDNKIKSREVSNDEIQWSFSSNVDEIPSNIIKRKEQLAHYRVIIQEALNKLSINHAQILKLVLIEGMTYKEVSSKLRIPEGTVMSRLFEAKQQARKVFQKSSLVNI